LYWRGSTPGVISGQSSIAATSPASKNSEIPSAFRRSRRARLKASASLSTIQ